MAVIGQLADVLRRNAEDPWIRRGLEYLGALGEGFLAAEALGYSSRIELDGPAIVALHQVYRSRSPSGARYEAHRSHVDLHYVIRGRERIRLGRPGSEEIQGTYDPEGDLAFFRAEAGMDLVLRAGTVAILYPEDLHAPCLSLHRGATVVKTVVKIRF